MTGGRVAGAVLALVLGGAAAPAADLALMIETFDYRTGGDLPPEAAEGAEALAAGLAAAGYEVLRGRNLSAADLYALLGRFAARLPEADRVVIYAAGNPVTRAGETWLPAADIAGAGPVLASYTAPSFGLLLGLASAARNGALVVVETGQEGFADLVLLENGTAPVNPPERVLYVEGPAGGLGGFVAATLLAPGVSAPEGVAAMADQVRVAGTAPAIAFGPPEPVQPPALGPAPVENPDEAAERALNLSPQDRAGIQEALAVLGFDPRGIDGVFGPNTRSAIGRWQAAAGLPATGFLKSGDLAALSAAAQARAAEIAADAERQRRAAEAEDEARWRATGASGREGDLIAYLRSHPDGRRAEEARAALQAIEAARQKSIRQAERQAWADAERAGSIAAYRAYLQGFPQGPFAETARARIEDLREAGRLQADRTRAAEREAAMGLSRATRVSVEGRLRALGYRTGPEDGVFDIATRNALRAFQRTRGLAATGYLSGPTLARLVAETGRR